MQTRERERKGRERVEKVQKEAEMKKREGEQKREKKPFTRRERVQTWLFLEAHIKHESNV